LEVKNENKFDFKYVQIKNKILTQNSEKVNLLQLIDLSSQVMFEFAKGDKKLMSLINATVSHEMRNPINSLKS
jgi:hypothetical protein